MPRASKAATLKPSEPKSAFWFRKVVLGLSIGILFTLFVTYGIKTFYEEPDWNKLCGPEQYRYAYPIGKEGAMVNQTRCDAIVPSIESLPCEPQYRTTIYNSTLDCQVPQCNTCQISYDLQRERYDSNVFIISIIAGALALVIGVILGVEAVGSGLMFGGVLTIFIGVVRNWGHLGNIVKFIILGAVLAALIWIGYRKLKD